MELITILIIIVLLVLIFIAYIIGNKIGKMSAERNLPELIQTAREDATKRSRSVLTGQFSEQLAPYFPDFPFSPTEVRFIGKPIDFIVFKGMDEKQISEVVFVEVKTGNSQLSSQERNLRDAIKNKNVSWEEYRLKR